MTLATTIQVLLIVLIAVATLASARLYFVLGDVRRVLGNVETTLDTTRKDIAGTLERLESVAQSTEQVMREEVAPTLKVARETLAHLEVTTHAIADTTLIARKVAHRADALVDTQKLLSVGGMVAQFVAKRGASAAAGLLSGVGAGIGAGVRALLPRRREAEPKTKEAPRLKSKAAPKALPDAPPQTNQLLPAEPGQEPVTTGGRKKR